MSKTAIILTVIIAPLIVGTVLLHMEYSFFSPNSQPEQSLAKEAQEVVEALDNQKDTSLKKKEIPIDESYIEPHTDDLKTLFDIARKIYGNDERNLELRKIIKLALSEKKPGFAFNVAKYIYGNDKRNSELIKTIDVALLKKA